jgi:uncharacterized repeat protein (TIGR01451 family)
MLDGNNAWGTYSGLYVVPVGQTTTRFQFDSIFSVGGASFGNFLDDVSLGTAACVIVTKSVTNLTRGGTDALVGDILEYTVSAQNAGGVPATMAAVTDQVPAGTTFEPGSIGGSGGAVTDAALDGDTGEYVAGIVTGRIGDGANQTSGGSIPAGESRTLTFRVSVDSGSLGSTVANEANVAFVEPLSAAPSISLSNTTATPVVPSADLEVSQTLDTPLVRGGAAQYTITVSNNGPQSSTDTDLTSSLPFQGMAANDPDCQVVLAQLTCHFGTLASGASRVIVLTGTVPAGSASSTSYQLVSSVDGSAYDPNTNNNSVTTLASVSALALAASGSSPEVALWLVGILLLSGIGVVGGRRIRRAARLE